MFGEREEEEESVCTLLKIIRELALLSSSLSDNSGLGLALPLPFPLLRLNLGRKEILFFNSTFYYEIVPFFISFYFNLGEISLLSL